MSIADLEALANKVRECRRNLEDAHNAVDAADQTLALARQAEHDARSAMQKAVWDLMAFCDYDVRKEFLNGRRTITPEKP